MNHSWLPSVSLLCAILLAGFATHAQNYLSTTVSLEPDSEIALGELLTSLEQQEDFYFSYDSRLVPEDSIISYSGQQVIMGDLLRQILTDDFEFRESPGYVIIRYAPGKLGIDTDVNQQDNGRTIVISGQITDLYSGVGIDQASVYEKNKLISTLTDENGNFTLTVKNSNTSVWLSVSKENYRDTSMIIFTPVNIHSDTKNRKYRYFPESRDDSGIYKNFLGRWFISARQRIQNLNLGGFFAYSPFQISLTPGLSTHGMYHSQVINRVSLNIAGGYTAGVDGVELAGAFNINQKNVRFLQAAGMFNLVGGQVRGVQLAGVSNIVVDQNSGVQVAGVINNTTMTRGLQVAGVMNRAVEQSGLQVAGVLNFTRITEGIQVAGVLNKSTGNTGSQFAGVVNIGGNVNGIQVAGLINIADSSDYPVGLINIIGNGRKSLSAGIDESSMVHVTFRSGGRKLYGLLGAGYHLDPGYSGLIGLEMGLGAHLFHSGWYNLDGEFVHRLSTNFADREYTRVGLKPLSWFRIHKKFHLFVGPTFNFTYQKTDNLPGIPGWILSEHSENGKYRGWHIGIAGGMALTL